MKPRVDISRNGKTMVVRVPISFRARGARKAVLVPSGAEPWNPVPPMPNNAVLKALGQAWRWKQMIETGEYDTIEALAKAEGVNFSYLCRVLRLTLLSPKLIEACLSGKSALQLASILKPLPADWSTQEGAVGPS